MRIRDRGDQTVRALHGHVAVGRQILRDVDVVGDDLRDVILADEVGVDAVRE